MNVQVAPGTIFANDYRVVRPLGVGGMGAVWEVQQLSTGRHRALKLMQPSLLSDPKARERFQHEAQITAEVSSDHVVDVLAAGIDPQSGSPWLVMELLHGEDVSARIERVGPLAPAEAVVLLRQLAHGLGAAHRAGIVHRDLKPENVFLAESYRSDAPLTVKILDFGIASLARDAHTRAGSQPLGSPYWLAPEQATTGAPLSPAADIWAFGLLAFYLLAGKPYWKTASSTGTGGLATALGEVLTSPLVPASQRASELGAPGRIPAGFDIWFFGCVHRDASARYQDVEHAMRELEPALGTPPRTLMGSSRTSLSKMMTGHTLPIASRAKPAGARGTDGGIDDGAPAGSGGGATPPRAQDLTSDGGPPVISPFADTARVGGMTRHSPQRDGAARSTDSDDDSLPPTGAHRAFRQRSSEGGAFEIESSPPRNAPGAARGGGAQAVNQVETAHRPEPTGSRHMIATVAADAPFLGQTRAERPDARGPGGALHGSRTPGAQTPAPIQKRSRAGMLILALLAVLLGAATIAGVAILLKRRSRTQEAECTRENVSGCVRLGDGEAVTAPARAVERYRLGCEGNDGYSCSRLATFYGEGRGVTRDDAQSAAHHDRACRLGVMPSCAALASMRERGLGGPQDLAATYALHKTACLGGHLASCESVGLLLQRGRGVARNRAEARTYYQRACDAGAERGCSRVAQLVFDGIGVQRDPARSLAASQRACDAGDAYGCTVAGRHYDYGRGVPHDDARAVGLYRRGCDGGELEGCAELAGMLASGEGVVRDQAQAIALASRSCDGGQPLGCLWLGALHLKGQGTQRDPARAFELMGRACALGYEQACIDQGWLRANGEGTARDEPAALAVFQRHCDEGWPSACAALAAMTYAGRATPRDQARAAVLYQRACDAADDSACGDLGLLYLSGEGVARDETRGVGLLERSCSASIPWACRSLAIQLTLGRGIARDDNRARALFELACTRDDATACRELGTTHRMGRGVPVDLARSVGFYQRGCDLGSGDACFQLGVMYLRGTGVVVDDARSLGLQRRGCDLSSADACTEAGALYALGRGAPRDLAQSRIYWDRGCTLGSPLGCRLRGTGSPPPTPQNP